jgi:hypothetical protein
MKIIKSNYGNKTIYDTSDILTRERFSGNFSELGKLPPLHQTHNCSDYEFLKKFFPEEHSIFIDFSESYFYVYEND